MIDEYMDGYNRQIDTIDEEGHRKPTVGDYDAHKHQYDDMSMSMMMMQ